jgi:hypothetical protein
VAEEGGYWAEVPGGSAAASARVRPWTSFSPICAKRSGPDSTRHRDDAEPGQVVELSV